MYCHSMEGVMLKVRSFNAEASDGYATAESMQVIREGVFGRRIHQIGNYVIIRYRKD
jgi:hypothetical protein